ncbi:hypothetical protein [Streptomyces sp. NPDC056660]|uniref:hypothetical protein n=1 Tax=Streptomyces sp. NPDC056660 TaxID=3345897 RepID=UPI003691C94B
MRVTPGVVDGDGRPGNDLLGQEQVLVVVAIGVATTGELSDTERGLAGAQRNREVEWMAERPSDPSA